jgi:hypothetical protein
VQDSNGQKVEPNGNLVATADDARHVSQLTPAQVEFIDFVLFHGIEVLCRSLKQVHDWALYHSDVPFDADEKYALFNLKLLWEELERINEAA